MTTTQKPYLDSMWKHLESAATILESANAPKQLVSRVSMELAGVALNLLSASSRLPNLRFRGETKSSSSSKSTTRKRSRSTKKSRKSSSQAKP
jgi:hypothetical protein